MHVCMHECILNGALVTFEIHLFLEFVENVFVE